MMCVRVFVHMCLYMYLYGFLLLIANCTAGTHLSPDNKTCTECEKHFYQPNKWKHSCIACPDRTGTEYKGSADPSDCSGKCIISFISEFLNLKNGKYIYVP